MTAREDSQYRLLEYGIEETLTLQNLLLDRPQTSNLRRTRSDQTISGNSIANDSRNSSVEVEHIFVNSGNLGKEESSNACACRNIGFEDVGENFDVLG